MNSNAPLFANVERLSATSAAASSIDTIWRSCTKRRSPIARMPLWQARGCGHGHDYHDWFEAERQLASSGGRPMGGYHLMRAEIAFW